MIRGNIEFPDHGWFLLRPLMRCAGHTSNASAPITGSAASLKSSTG
jgi:hypothetical protein